MTILFVISIGIDLLWFFAIYLNILKSDEYKNLARWEGGIHTTVLIVGIINVVVKLISIVLSIMFEPEVRMQVYGTNPAYMGTRVQ